MKYYCNASKNLKKKTIAMHKLQDTLLTNLGILLCRNIYASTIKLVQHLLNENGKYNFRVITLLQRSPTKCIPLKRRFLIILKSFYVHFYC